MTTEAEVEDFTDELSDEALDRAEGASILGSSGNRVGKSNGECGLKAHRD
jgi:hypothetical protein